MVKKMNDWFFFSVAALLLWGLWGFFPKLAVNYIDPKSALVYNTIGTVIIGAIVFFLAGFKLEFNTNGITFAILAGAAGALGGLFFLYAVSKGSLPVVVTATALYPIVTIGLAFLILKEPITLKQGLGILFSLIAIMLLSS